MTDPELIVSAIERKGWRTVHTGAEWLVTAPDSAPDGAPDGAPSSGLTARLSCTPSWVCLDTPLPTGVLPPGDAPTAQRVAFYRALLAHNEQIFVAKFALDRAGTPRLCAEVPAADAVRRVEGALAALSHALARYAAGLAQPDPPGRDRATPERFFEAPPGIPPEVLASYVHALAPHGWGLRSKPQGITWPLGYKGQRVFDVYLTVTRAWAYVHVPLLPEETLDLDSSNLAVQHTLLAYLLALNAAWFMAKVGLDEQGRVLLMLEVPTQELDFDTFRLVTRLLAAYLDRYAREIQIMAHLPADRALMERLIQ